MGARAAGILSFVAAVAIAACGNDTTGGADGGRATVCTPGGEASCLCPGGMYAGVLTCAADGSGYGACTSCPPYDGGPFDAGDDGDDASDASEESDGALDAEDGD